jgi:hypothetical protein
VLRVRVSRGVLIRQAEERESRKYTIRNQDREPRTVVIEHPARPEWTITGEAKPVESTAGAHRFRVEVGAGATAVVQVDEMRPAMAQFSLAQLDDQQLTLIVQRAPDREALERALRPVLDKRAEVARLAAEIQAREAEVAAIGQDQSRVRENMKALERSQAERRLLDRYVRELDAQETRLDEIERELASLRAARQTAAGELDELIRTVSLDVTF